MLQCGIFHILRNTSKSKNWWAVSKEKTKWSNVRFLACTNRQHQISIIEDSVWQSYIQSKNVYALDPQLRMHHFLCFEVFFPLFQANAQFYHLKAGG